MHNIDNVVKDDLCTGCGVCAAACPTKAIEMCLSNGLLLAKVDNDRCTGCQQCVRCCPGFSLDFLSLNVQVFGKHPKDQLLGNFLKCYLGHSNDDEIRSVSPSGGVVSQILIHALENGVVDGALIVRMKEGSPLEPEPFIARTRKEVLSGVGSNYCPCASGVAVEKIMAMEGKFAVVGLPCHIHGIRKAEAMFKELKEKIVLHVGLFCGHTVSYDGTAFLLKKLGIEKGEVARLQYRGNGWPDSMHVQLKNGRRVSVKFNNGWNAYWNVFSPFFFTPLRCMMCPDQFNELADVSVGDAWLPELKHNPSRESIAIARTKFAEDMLASLQERSLLSLTALSPDKVKESQSFSLNYKKQSLSGRFSFFSMFGKKTPRINPESPRSAPLAYAGAFLSFASLKACSSKRVRSLMVYVPLPIFRLYFGLFRSVSLLSGQGRC